MSKTAVESVSKAARRSKTIIFVGGLLALVAVAASIYFSLAAAGTFARHSAPYYLFLALAVSLLLYIGFLFYHFRRKALQLILVLVFLFGLAIGIIELAGHVYAFAHPSYRVLSFEPDRILGWKLAPNFQFTWTGHHWYAREFSVPIKTNSHGFRDLERNLAKPQDTIRVALLGDSMVEALQVPLEKTAGQLLERKLRARPASLGDGPHQYEVLNFGVSNYGVGQYLLAWEQYAAKLKPDYVFILVGEIHLDRTVTKYEPSALSTKSKPLWLRPTFRMEQDELVRESAAGFADFVKAQAELVDSEFGPVRIARREHGLFIAPLLELSFGQILAELQRSYAGPQKKADRSRFSVNESKPIDPEMLKINLEIIAELGRQVRAGGAELIIVDVSNYFRHLRWQSLPSILREFCADKGFGWIALGEELLTAEARGIATRWPHDQHFNETGNALFAEAMYRWYDTRAKR